MSMSFQKKLVFFMTILFLCYYSAFAWSGPWSKKAGHFYMKLSENALYSFQGSLGESNVNYLGITTAFYGEVGLGYGTQVVAYIPYTIARHISPDSHYELGGFADAIIGLQWTPPPLQKQLGFPVAVKVDIKVPMYDPHHAKQQPDLAEKNIAARFPILGIGNIDFTFWLSIGGSVPKTKLYLFADVGFRLRTGIFTGTEEFASLNYQPLHNFVFFTQLGYNFGPVLLSLNNSGTISLGKGDELVQSVSPTFITVGLGLYAPVLKRNGHTLALEANFDYTYFAINSTKPISATIGLSYSF